MTLNVALRPIAILSDAGRQSLKPLHFRLGGGELSREAILDRKTEMSASAGPVRHAGAASMAGRMDGWFPLTTRHEIAMEARCQCLMSPWRRPEESPHSRGRLRFHRQQVLCALPSRW